MTEAASASGTSMYDELGVVFEHLNSTHDDTVLFIARHLVGPASDGADRVPVVAQLRSAAPSGITIGIRRGDGTESEFDHPFDVEPASLDEVRGVLFALLGAARTAVGDSVPLTSLERELAGAGGLTTFISEVVAARDLTPTLREITFGTGLDDFSPLGWDQFLFVLLPPAGRSELTVGTDFTWSLNEELPEAERPQGAYYTVRRWRADVGEIDMWFALHGDAGPASAWAQRAEPGMPAGLWGPRSTFAAPESTERYLLVVDDTGLGAATAILDQLRDRAPQVQVIAETVDERHVVELPTWDGVGVEWTYRRDAAPGTAGLLLDAVRASSIEPEALYAFGAAESREITAVRKHLRDRVGLPADQTSMTGYWRR